MKPEGNYSSLVIAGPSGAGKTDLLKLLLSRQRRFQKVITSTTRPPRANEVNGVDYHFLSEQDFLSKIRGDLFIEHAKVHRSFYYGNTWEEFAKIKMSGNLPVYILDVQGAKNLKDKVQSYSIFIEVPGLPDTSELVRRLRQRGDSEESIANRMASVPFELSQRGSFDRIIVNEANALERTYAELVDCISENLPGSCKKL